ncbi:ATP-binding protein [Amycolatopsis pigmentata]|uniref:ATP-binding protein n=1 Tax=Amycolatopsis pigmentata TaxID=450801 RepID=A0ABW5G660_9PSEU
MSERATTRPAGNLPASVTSFIGRKKEISDIRKSLSTSRLVTLTGVGGVGKTRLAIEAAYESRKAFADGVWLVDLATVNDSALVARTVANTLGIPDQSTKSAPDQLTEFLADRRTLLVLDNCEHLVHACAVLADHLLRCCEGLRILATSRQTLAITGERIFTVPPLSVPDPRESEDVVDTYDAPALFFDRAAAIQPDLELSDGKRHTVARLCARLDGLPLAIELAATRVRSLPVEQIIERLDDRFGLLTGGSRAAVPRQRTLRALIDWSYDLCSPAERLLWSRLSVFAGEFDLAAAEGVCAGEDLPREDVLDLIDRLVAQSILLVTSSESGPRYRLLETIRQYGAEKLAGSGEETTLRRRHRDFFLALSEDIADHWNGPGQEAGLARLRADHGNLRAALEWCASDPGSRREGLAMVAALRYHWCADGFLSEGRRWLDRMLALPPTSTVEPELRAKALWVAAWATLLQGDHDVVEARLDECETLASEPATLGRMTSLRGSLAFFRGNRDEATRDFERSLALLSATTEQDGILLTLFQLNMIRASDPLDDGFDAGKEAIALAERLGERSVRSYALWSVAFEAWVRGDAGSAGDWVREALMIQRGFNDHSGAAMMIELLAWMATDAGEYRRAARLLGAVHALFQTLGTSISAFGPQLAQRHSHCQWTTLRALRTEAFQSAFAEGTRMYRSEAISYALGEGSHDHSPEDTDRVLTPRERQVAELVTQGMSNRKIAESLVVSPRTVEGHVEHILAKLGFTSRAQIAAWNAASTSAGPRF